MRFFDNHGMLSVNDRPQWRAIRGGSARYVEKLVAPFRDRIRLNTPVAACGACTTACSSKRAARARALRPRLPRLPRDQALRLLADASRSEREVLGAIRYQRNEAVLHTDTTPAAARRRAWAAWNYHRLEHESDRVALSPTT